MAVVAYGAEPWQVADWHPATTPVGVLVMVAGGAWVGSSRAEYDTNGATTDIPAAGWSVLNIAHGNWGDATLGVDLAVSDVRVAMAYARGQEPGVPLALWGDSSGAQLALVAAAHRDADVAGVVAISPPCSMRDMRSTLIAGDPELSLSTMNTVVGATVLERSGTWDRLSPLRRTLDLRPIPVMVGTWAPDGLVPAAVHGLRFGARLDDQGGTVTFSDNETGHAYSAASLAAGLAFLGGLV